MTETQGGRPQLRDLEETIKDRIAQRTRVRMRSLTVAVSGDRIVISGWAPSYYLMQLALQGALEAAWSAGAYRVELNVHVAASPPNDTCREAE
jgi:hypothetical protein